MTTSVIEVGKLLNDSRKHLEHGEWKPWLAENFDLSYQTALNYCDAAKYVEQKSNVGHFDFENLSARVLYALAAGDTYDEQEEAAILAATREGRVDTERAFAISGALAPPPDDDDVEAADDNGSDETTAAEDPEIEAILAAGADPRVPPPAPIPPLPGFALRAFDDAIRKLEELKTKSCALFIRTVHSANDLESVEEFIRAVRARLSNKP